jgi:transposase
MLSMTNETDDRDNTTPVIPEARDALVEAYVAVVGINREQGALILELQKTIEALTAKIVDLEARLSSNSRNSSKPPSSDGYSKPAPKSRRKPSGKKPGGQKGHEGRGFKLPHEPDSIVHHFPDKCEGCPKAGLCPSGVVRDTRRVVEMVARVNVEEHRAYSRACIDLPGETLEGKFPDGVTGTAQYGDFIAAFAAALNVYGMMSVGKIHELLSSVFGIGIAVGTIQKMIDRCAKGAKPAAEVIREAFAKEEVIHVDETGFRVAGGLKWVHVAATEFMTYFSVQSKRGKEGMDAIGIIAGLMRDAIISHDCWGPYFKYLCVLHALCCAHVLRELEAIVDRHEGGRQWAGDMIGLLVEMNDAVAGAKEAGAEALYESAIADFEARYDEIVDAGRAVNPIVPKPGGKRGRPAKGKERALVDRMGDHRDGFLMFARDFRVPFDNSEAERSIRILKLKQKTVGGMRTVEGAEDFAALLSFISTMRKNGIDVFKSVLGAIQDYAVDMASGVVTA